MEEISFSTLKETYFSDPERTITIRAGETLMEQHEYNDRLYIVLEGCVQGFLPELDLKQYPVFESGPDHFVGVYSFFAKEHRSYTKVVAKEDSKLAYFRRQNQQLGDEEYRGYVNFFTSIILNELVTRQKFARRMAKERQDDQQKLLRVEKMATLGQMAAGLAHELNNAVGVIKSNTEWLDDQVNRLIQVSEVKEYYPVFQEGLKKGQYLSSAEARKYRQKLEKMVKVPSPMLKRIARTGLDAETIKSFAKRSDKDLERMVFFWEMGSNFHDLHVAINHSSHVVQSVKTLGISRQVWIDDVDVSATINEALTILKGILKNVHIQKELDLLPAIYGCPGELIQVWINLIKNAAESMLGAETPDPTVTIHAKGTDDHVIVEVSDNGPGIPEDIADKIFEPSFTTKVSGLSFGLGLGLSIVQRIVADHNGRIQVISKPGRTTFTILLPLSP